MENNIDRKPHSISSVRATEDENFGYVFNQCMPTIENELDRFLENQNSSSNFCKIIGNYQYTKDTDGYLRARYIGNDVHITEEPLRSVDGEFVVSYEHMFANTQRIKSVDMSNWDLTNIKQIDSMFNNCKNLEIVTFGTEFSKQLFANDTFNNCVNLKTVAGFKVNSKILEAENMFSNCTSIENIDLTGVQFSRYVNGMFDNCVKLKNVKGLAGNIWSYNYMFRNCHEITDIDLSGLNFEIENHSVIISNCPKLERVYINKCSTNVLPIILNTVEDFSINIIDVCWLDKVDQLNINRD